MLIVLNIWQSSDSLFLQSIHGSLSICRWSVHKRTSSKSILLLSLSSFIINSPWSYGVMVSTADSDSADLSSSLSRTSILCLLKLLYLIKGERNLKMIKFVYTNNLAMSHYKSNSCKSKCVRNFDIEAFNDYI